MKRNVLSIQPCSLAKAISEPVNEIEPISAPTTASISCDWLACGWLGTKLPMPIPANASSALAPIAAAEPPPMPLYSATICGMSVMATFLPLYHASAVLTLIAASMMTTLCMPLWKNVAITATSTPTPAHWMPLRAVTGEDMRLMPMISSTAATK